MDMYNGEHVRSNATVLRFALYFLKICTKLVVLHHGELIADGEPHSHQ